MFRNAENKNHHIIVHRARDDIFRQQKMLLREAQHNRRNKIRETNLPFRLDDDISSPHTRTINRSSLHTLARIRTLRIS